MTMDVIRETATTASLLAMVMYALFQLRINRLMRKRIELLEMLVYWQGQFNDGTSRKNEGG
jgi:hypothetical protein